MATSIFFNGRLISIPGSYSEVDASGLEVVGLGASGIVAVLGTAEGGKPVTAMSESKDFIRLTKPSQTAQTFRSGDLLEVGDMLFAPAKDEAIPGGAQQVIPMKVNPATQSTASLSNVNGPALDFTSDDYGAFTEQINVALQTGTSKGKLLTIKFEDLTEAKDDLGGDAIFTLTYANPGSGATGWPTITAEVASDGSIKVDGTRTTTGKDSTINGTQLSTNTEVEIVSDNAGDVAFNVVLYGLNASGVPVKETVLTNGTTAVPSTNTFSKITGATYDGADNITIRIVSAGATVATIAGSGSIGVLDARVMYVSGSVVTVAATGPSTDSVVIEGKTLSGATAQEKIVLSGTTPVSGTVKFTEITRLVLGVVAAATTVEVLAEVAKASSTVAKTLAKAADYFNARSVPSVGGFTFTLLTAQTQMALTDLDVSNNVTSILSPTTASFYADLFAIASWVNNNSQLVSAAVSTGASGGAPSNTSSPVFLAGGSEGTTLFTHWQQALNLLKKTRVNSVVVLTADPAVHAALDAHCAYMGGIGRSERDGFVGLMNDDQTDLATKTQIKAQIVDLNSRHIRAYAQAIERFNTAGERTEFSPMFLAAIAAGAQAGAPVGEPLTFKYMNVLSFRQNSTWNPTDDSQEMIDAGLSFLENIEGKGRRIVRNITTWLQSNNLAFIEGSVNQAVNFATFNFRTSMEASVGKRGFAGTINAAKGVAVGELGLLVDAGTLVAWRNLTIDLTIDVLEVDVEIAPVLPINFVKNTLHLVTIQQSAA